MSSFPYQSFTKAVPIMEGNDEMLIYIIGFLLLKNTVIHLKQKIIIHNITNLDK